MNIYRFSCAAFINIVPPITLQNSTKGHFPLKCSSWSGLHISLITFQYKLFRKQACSNSREVDKMWKKYWPKTSPQITWGWRPLSHSSQNSTELCLKSELTKGKRSGRMSPEVLHELWVQKNLHLPAKP